jgi:S-adenosylmethionine/arginine decarboxylase-like enzyme
MQNIEPRVFRQRALIEAKASIKITKGVVKEYLKGLANHLELRIYGGPIAYSTHDSGGKKINQGLDGFCSLIDSGISISTWNSTNLVAVLMHTCKKFKVEDAVKFTKKFFKAKKIVYKEF